MKCKEGHEMAKIPFQNHKKYKRIRKKIRKQGRQNSSLSKYMAIGLYCEICEPSHHKMYQKMKADRVAKMQMGKKNIKAVNLINMIAEVEGIN